jgi:hypothetical protein
MDAQENSAPARGTHSAWQESGLSWATKWAGRGAYTTVPASPSPAGRARDR